MEGNQQDILKSLKECEEYIMKKHSGETSVLGVLNSETELVKKYLNILKKSYYTVFYFNFFFFILITGMCLIELLLSVFIIKTKVIIIFESFVLLAMILLVFIQRLKRMRRNEDFIFGMTWIVFIVFTAGGILNIYQVQLVEGHMLIIGHVTKYYFYQISSHLLVCFNIKVFLSRHYGHFMAFLAIDMCSIIGLNITAKYFFFETVTIIVLDSFPFIYSYMTELFNKPIFDRLVEKQYLYLKNEEIIQNSSIGIVVTTEGFEIKENNSIFIKEMKDLICDEVAYQMEGGVVAENGTLGPTEVLTSKQKLNTTIYPESQELVQKSVLKSRVDERGVYKKGIRKRKNAVVYNMLESTRKFLSVHKMFEKDIDEKEIKKKDIEVNFSEALENDINNLILSGESDKLKEYNYLGRFFIKSNLSLYSVKWKKTYKMPKLKKKTQEPPGPSLSQKNLREVLGGNLGSTVTNNPFYYKFIFTEITKNRDLERIKVEQIYQNLILGKLKHEFNRPIELIQKTIEELQNPYLKRGSYKSEIEYQVPIARTASNVISKQVKDPYTQIKYYLEIINLRLRDIMDYINIYSSKPENASNQNTRYQLTELEEFLKYITLAYVDVFDKNIKVKMTVSDKIKEKAFDIDKKKLNQILSGLIANSLKNVNDDGVVSIKIDKMKTKDIKHFEFWTKDIVFNNKYEGVPSQEQENEKKEEEAKANKEKEKSPPKKKVPMKMEKIKEEEEEDIDLGIVIKIEDTGIIEDSTLVQNILSRDENFFIADDADKKFNNAEKYYKFQMLEGLKICKKVANEIGVKIKGKNKKKDGCVKSNYRVFIKTELLSGTCITPVRGEESSAIGFLCYKKNPSKRKEEET